jgi:hypothetical protein
MRSRDLAFALAGVVLASAAALRAERSAWLPAELERLIAAQLSERLRTASDGRDPAAVARLATAAMAAKIESWGVEGTLARAPALSQLGVQPLADRHLDAMQRYLICNGPPLLDFEASDPPLDSSIRFSAAILSTGLTLAVLRLRQPFIDAGGTPAAMESAMTRSEIDAPLQKMQSDPAAREPCRPLYRELLEAAVRSFESGTP